MYYEVWNQYAHKDINFTFQYDFYFDDTFLFNFYVMLSFLFFLLHMEHLKKLASGNFGNENDIVNFLDELLHLLDLEISNQQIYQIGIDTFKKHSQNNLFKQHLINTVFSGEDFNVAHYNFARKLLKENLIDINDIHQAINLIPQKHLTPPCGPDFALLFLATPVLFFNKELSQQFPDDFKNYCAQIKQTFNSSPKIKRLPLEWETPLNIRNQCYGLMNEQIDFDPDNEQTVIAMAGNPDKIPKVKIY